MPTKFNLWAVSWLSSSLCFFPFNVCQTKKAQKDVWYSSGKSRKSILLNFMEGSDSLKPAQSACWEWTGSGQWLVHHLYLAASCPSRPHLPLHVSLWRWSARTESTIQGHSSQKIQCTFSWLKNWWCRASLLGIDTEERRCCCWWFCRTYSTPGKHHVVFLLKFKESRWSIRVQEMRLCCSAVLLCALCQSWAKLNWPMLINRCIKENLLTWRTARKCFWNIPFLTFDHEK